MKRTFNPCQARSTLFRKYSSRIEINPILTRSLVSYQANKSRPFYRWFKYKEGFSADMVEYLLDKKGATGTVLDPFAGAGATLFAAQEMGWQSTGIELLPVGVMAMQARLASHRLDRKSFNKAINAISGGTWKREDPQAVPFAHLRITQHAFSEMTESQLAQYRAFIHTRIDDPDLKKVLDFAAICVLENISFTRKDGQYLRWDQRSARQLKGKPFHKGHIPSFEEALLQQLQLMQEDLAFRPLFTDLVEKKEMVVKQGSCFQLLPAIPDVTFDCIITSPPYCNRYDYTRTYALELAYLKIDDQQLSELRQALLSCTVENKAKTEQLRQLYQHNPGLLQSALSTFENQDALHEVIKLLEIKANDGLLNNPNIVRMIYNYFLESCVTVFEMARLLKPGGTIVMVNDNVQYGGEEVPVDLILCEFAAAAGLVTDHIWTLGRGKGNSSQQMGEHGRNELRKCAYVWRKL